jgi:pimeloyl-ACP methyl ester carboxylesterase
VLAFDPLATGSRQEERRDFYVRHPHWSLMGQMVLDARNALDAALANPDVDSKRLYLVGFGMGGMVATLTAALDNRVTAVVSASGFSPFRDEVAINSTTGGLRRWFDLYGWLPRLGRYELKETTVPVDFPEILEAIAPRPMLVIAPALDWHHPQASVSRAVATAGSVYSRQGAASKLQLYTPSCLAELNNDIQSHITRFLHR